MFAEGGRVTVAAKLTLTPFRFAWCLVGPVIFKFFEANNNAKGWVQGPGGPKRDSADGIAPDRHGGAYAVGSFTDSIRIWGQTIVSAGKADGFLVRYRPRGETQWARAIGGPGYDALADVASDAAGNVDVVGTIRGPVDVDCNGTIDVTSEGEPALLLACFDAHGKLRWARASAGPAAARGVAIAVGANGDIYIGGDDRNGAVDFDADGRLDVAAAADTLPGVAVTPQTDLNGYFARFDSTGALRWARAVTGPAVFQRRSPMVLKSKSAMPSASSRLRRGFLARFSPGGERRWVRRYAATAGHVAADATRIVISGSYTERLDLDDDGTPERDAGFVAILDGEGRLRHVFTIFGGDSDVANAAGFTPDGRKLYVTGCTKRRAHFDNDGTIESESACHQLGDVFLALYSVEDLMSPI